MNGNLTSDSQLISILYNGTPVGTWDGTANSGDKVTNGTYIIKIDSTDPFGVTTTVSREVTVLIGRNILTATIYNEAGEAVKHFTQADLQALVAGSSSSLLASDYDVAQVRLPSNVFAPDYSGSTAANRVLTILMGSGRGFTWNGEGDNGAVLMPGTYYLQFDSQVTGQPDAADHPDGPHRGRGQRHQWGGAGAQPDPGQPAPANPLFPHQYRGVNVTSTTVRIYTVAGEWWNRLTTTRAILAWCTGMCSGKYRQRYLSSGDGTQFAQWRYRS